MAQKEIDIRELHVAILAKIKEQFPDLATVEPYQRQGREKMAVPAVLLELGEMERSDDPGTEQLCLDCRFDLYVVMDGLDPEVRMDIRCLTASLARFIHGQRWGLPVAPASVAGLAPSDFSVSLGKYEEWQISWSQEIYIGPSCWAGEGVIPTEILYSMVPLIGEGNVENYELLTKVRNETSS